MVLPQTYFAALAVMILGMLCWGSWANTLKLSGKWRYELFYFDYAFGVLLAAAFYALTAGSLGFDGFSFVDDLMHAGKRQWVYGVGAGIIFNLANMFLVAAISVAGLAVTFPTCFGMAMVIGAIWSYAIKPQGNPVLLFSGATIIIAAIIVDALAYRALAASNAEQLAKSGKSKTTKKKAPLKGIILSLVSGLLMGSFFPLIEFARAGESGLGPYAIGFLFAVGIFTSTFMFNLFFMNLPVEGEPVGPADYFRGNLKKHVLGILGGVIWCTGTISIWVAASAPESAQIAPAISYAIGQGATIVSALWGLLVWKEFASADSKPKSLAILMLVLFVCGLGLVSIAPLFVLKTP